MNRSLVAVVLAGGLGTRMKDRVGLGRKPIVKVEGKSLASYGLETVSKLATPVILVVNPHYKEMIQKELGNQWVYIGQPSPNGNAGALIASLRKLKTYQPRDILVVQVDDSALYTEELLRNMVAKHRQTKATITMLTLKDPRVPQGFWQVGLDKKRQVNRVFRGGSDLEKETETHEAIAGCFLFKGEWLLNEFRPELMQPEGKEKGELILPDVLQQALDQSKKMVAIQIKYGEDWLGVNTKEELSQLASALVRKRMVGKA